MRKKVLVLTPRFPYPGFGGDRMRIHQLCSALAKKYDLVLVSICQSKAELEQTLPIDAPFIEAHKVFLPKWQSYIQTIMAVIAGKSLQIAYYRSNQFSKKVDAILSVNKFDLVVCHLARVAPYAKSFLGVKILELSDYLPLTYSRAMLVNGNRNSLKSLAYRFEGQRIDAAQNQLASDFDLISFVSEVDAGLFQKSSGIAFDRIATYPMGISLNDKPCLTNRSGKIIVFIGNIKTLQNRDAVSYFSRHVWPIILSAHPDAEFKIIGDIDESFKNELSSLPRIIVTGRVQLISEETRDCTIGVCPVRVAAGIQVKILDYMALGLPTVATSFGAEGLQITDKIGIRIANTPEDFAGCVISLLSNSTERESISRYARGIVECSYSYQATDSKFQAIIDKLLLTPH